MVDILHRVGVKTSTPEKVYDALTTVDEEQVEHPAPGRVADRGPEVVVDRLGERGAHDRTSSPAAYGASRGR